MATIEEKEQEYRNYIDTHRANVKKAYEKIVKPYAKKYLSPQSVEILERNIENHDEDKDIDFIFDAYRKNHFPINDKEKELSQDEYKVAWDYHKKVNPHHWEFFLDDNDEDFIEPEITEDEKELYQLAYLEMLADWLSFSFKQAQEESGKGDGLSVTGDSMEFETWYNKNKNTIKIHPQLKEWFENIVNHIIEDLKKDNSILYEAILRREKYHEEKNTFIIQTKHGYLQVNPAALTYKTVLDFDEATKSDNREEMTLLLLKLLKKYQKLTAARVISIAELKWDMKANPQRYNFNIELAMQKDEQDKQDAEDNVFNGPSAIYGGQEDEEGEDLSVFTDDFDKLIGRRKKK